MELPENTHWIIVYNPDDETYDLQAPGVDYEGRDENGEMIFGERRISAVIKHAPLQKVIKFLQFAEDYEQGND